jgi:hypothetical protein
MNLMLSVLFLCVGLGLLAPRLGRRENLAIVSLAAIMASLYLFQGRRFI